MPLILIGALLILRALYVFTHGVDSDEPQTLHVIYRWWKGDLPYLGQFDNHTPLFHFLFLPFAALVGENVNVVPLARLALVPFSFGGVWLLYLLSRRLYDRRTALWGVAITLALADWSLKSIEVRPDILWMFLWFAALLCLVRPDKPASPVAFLLAGLLLGASAAVSVKTAFFLPALAIGWGFVWLVSKDFRTRYDIPTIVRCTVAGAIGMAVVPGLVVAFFASRGALDEMAFCVFTINKDPFLSSRSWYFVAGLPIAFAATAYLLRPPDLRTAYRAAVFLSAATYLLAIVGFGPYESLAKQTFLPVYPLLIVAACHLVFHLRTWRNTETDFLGTTVCVGLVAAMVWASPPLRDGMAAQRQLLQAVLDHTKPDAYLMDLKGETVFRKRPVYLAYVGNTTRAMENGRLPLPDPSKLQETSTAIATGRTTGFPAGMRSFLRRNYLATTEGELRVAGQSLKPTHEGGKWIERLRVEIPGEYVLVSGTKVVSERSIHEASGQLFEFPSRGRYFLFEKAAWDSGLRPAD